MWKIPDTSENAEKKNNRKAVLITDAHLRLRSHRSIVNQCAFNRKHFLLATSGIEKLVKIWSPYPLPGSSGGGLHGVENEFEPKRRLYTYSDLLNYRRQANESQRQNTQGSQNPPVPPVQNPSLSPPHNVDEDKTMIAFFDFQIQRKYHRRSESFDMDSNFDMPLSTPLTSSDSSNDISDTDSHDDANDGSRSNENSRDTDDADMARGKRSHSRNGRDNNDETSTNTSFSENCGSKHRSVQFNKISFI